MATTSSVLLSLLLLGSLSLSLTTAQTPSPSPAADSDSDSDSNSLSSPESGSPSPSPVFNSPRLSPPAPPPSDLLHSPASASAPAPSDGESPAPAPAEAVDGNKSGNAMATEDDQIGGPSGVSGGKKAGIVVGLVAAVCVVGLGGMIYRKRQQNLRRAQYGYAARAELL